ncbi:MAG: RNA polymerase sigma factor [Gemmatimonadales bacterium]
MRVRWALGAGRRALGATAARGGASIHPWCNPDRADSVQSFVTAIAMTTSSIRHRSAAVEIESLDASRAATGDQAAFERLYRRHVARIHTLVRRMADHDTADDLTQDIFVRAWDKLPTFRGESAFGTWLYRLAVNVVLSRRRGERGERTWILDDELAITNAPGPASHVASRIDLDAAIALLPDGARKVFVLHDVEGWTHEEIAQQMGLVPGTSKSQLSRARAALRRMLDAD